MRQRRAYNGSAPLTGVAIVALLSLPGAIGTARADADCTARILADVPALEASEQVKSKRSGSFGPITHIKVSKKSGQMYYCAENSYCYGSNAFQITTPCRFKLDKGASSGDYFQYSAR